MSKSKSKSKSNTRSLTRLLVLVTALLVLLAACAGDDDDSSAVAELTSSPQIERDGVGAADTGGADDRADEAPAEEVTEPTEPTEAAPESGAAEDDVDFLTAVDSVGEPGGGVDLTVPAVISALAVGRQIISTGEVVIESADVAKATADVERVVFANGGAIWGQDTRTDPSPQTVFTIRVPPADFARVLDAISELQGASLVSQSVTTDDVTETVVDLDARITASESSVERVQTLLDAARDLNTVFTLEEELAARQAQLERLRGQRKTIGDQIALATITLTIIELDPDRLTPEMEVVAWLGTDVDDACPGVSDLSIGADDSAVLCVNVSNTGEDTLTDIDVGSPTFRLRVDDFRVNQNGSGSVESLAPGEELLVYAELVADGGFISRVDASNGIPIDVTVTATPETSETVELSGSDSVFISADVDDPLPGFGDSFSGGWSAMTVVISILMIGIGVALPFIPFLLVAAWLGRKAILRSRQRAEAKAAFVEAYVASANQPEPSPPPPS